MRRERVKHMNGHMNDQPDIKVFDFYFLSLLLFASLLLIVISFRLVRSLESFFGVLEPFSFRLPPSCCRSSPRCIRLFRLLIRHSCSGLSFGAPTCSASGMRHQRTNIDLETFQMSSSNAKRKRLRCARLVAFHLAAVSSEPN